jgi:isoamylase
MSSVPFDHLLVAREMSADTNGGVSAGRSSPLGAAVIPGGVNFSIRSRSASSVELVLFDREEDARQARVITINVATDRIDHYWHVFVPGGKPGQFYGYRIQGRFDPARGMRFEPSKVLLV